MPGGSPIPQSPLRPSGMRAYETPVWSHHLGSFLSPTSTPIVCIRLKPRQTARNDDASDRRLRDFGTSASLAVQIVSQLVDGELVITNDILDQIADRDDSDQLSLVDHGKIGTRFSVITAMHSSSVRPGRTNKTGVSITSPTRVFGNARPSNNHSERSVVPL